jgi:hypothetical protein
MTCLEEKAADSRSIARHAEILLEISSRVASAEQPRSVFAPSRWLGKESCRRTYPSAALCRPPMGPQAGRVQACRRVCRGVLT